MPIGTKIGLICLALFLVTTALQCNCEPVAQPVKTIRMLTIGNSFADNIATYLPSIMQAAGYNLVLNRANIGGCPMEKHWKLASLHEANLQDPQGMPYTIKGQKVGLKEALMLEKWDFVTIQQYSVISTKIDTYRPYAKNLYDYIKQNAPQAEVLLHQTWAYRSDDPQFKTGTDSSEKMYQALTSAYQTIAGELHIRLVPVGDAFHLASLSPDFSYVTDTAFDFANAVYPNKPDQHHSLHMGWNWSKDKTTNEYKLSMDGHHANQAGQYLGGLVFFERLTGQSVIGNSFVPNGMNADDARILQRVAHEAVQNELAREKTIK